MFGYLSAAILSGLVLYLLFEIRMQRKELTEQLEASREETRFYARKTEKLTEELNAKALYADEIRRVNVGLAGKLTIATKKLQEQTDSPIIDSAKTPAAKSKAKSVRTSAPKKGPVKKAEKR